jgi:hypothetical protein
MAKVEADIQVKSFGYDGDGAGRRLLFPHAETQKIEGRSGATGYGAADCVFEGLEGRLDVLRWKADSASAGSAWLHDDGGRFDVSVQRAEFPSGVRLTRAADYGIEIISPHVTFSELKLTIKGPFGRKTDVEPKPAPKATDGGAPRQEKLRFLDSLSGRINMTMKVQLDLPVIGVRSLDQQLRVPIQEGSLDYRALDDSLDWLEGTFLDIKHEDQRLKVQWKVPIVGQGHDLITWALDTDASTLASFGRVPLRSLADFRTGSGKPPNPAASERTRKGGTLKSLMLDKIDVALSLLAPRSLDVGNGLIMFGGEDQPGMVDLKVIGAIKNSGAGAIKGAIGSIDTTIKDLEMGPTSFSADRLHFDGVNDLEVEFDGFRPTAVTMVIHRVTATNLAIKIGQRPPQPTVTAPSARTSNPAAPVDRTPPR